MSVRNVVELDQVCFHRPHKLRLTMHFASNSSPVHDDERPMIDEEWPAAIKCMLESSFDKDINLRPKASLFYDIIRDELKKLRKGDKQGLNESWILRRRSMCSFTRPELHPEQIIMLMSDAEEEEEESPQLMEDSS
jgi:hypothetical protein